ncbi:MAG: PUA domain-containing protein [Candidatus Aenigmatarchaeota archaeon]
MFLLLVDKPKGITSRQVCEIVKNKLNAKKAGHSGTLDANATGLLIVCLDKAVKAMPFFENLDKTYVGIMHMHKDFELDALEKITRKFVGEIIQKPPIKSRVKRVERKRTVHYFKILEINGKDVRFETRVQAGTYIRKLVDDIGKFLGGAHLKELRRIKIGNFDVENSCTIEKINKDCLIEMEKCIQHVKRVYVKNEFVPKIINGSPIFSYWITKTDAFEKGEKIAIFSSKLIGIGVALVSSKEANKNIKIIKTDRIF